MKKLYVILIAVLLVAVSIVFYMRSSSLTIHLMQESKTTNIDMTLTVDGNVVFQDSVESNLYLSEKIVLENLGIGFHEIGVRSELGQALYSQNRFHLFNRTLVLRYFEDAVECEGPCFDATTTFGKYLAE